MRHPRVRVAVAFLTGALLLAACGDDTDEPTATDPAGDEDVENEERDEARSDGGTDAGSVTSSTVDDEPVEQAPAGGEVIAVSVAGGDVEGGGRKEVALGGTVTLRVTSDVADHVHVHGYDIKQDVGAGETVEITFDATIPGVFEVELEEARIPLVELQVS